MTLTTIKRCLNSILLVLAPVIVFAQAENAVMEDALRELEKMVSEVNAFAGGVRFDSEDVESLITHWDEYAELGDTDEEESVDFDALLEDIEYRSWATSHNLVADDWLRKSVRISMIFYREQMLEGAAMMPEQIQQQMAMIEQQRDQVGEEVFQQMKAGMEATIRYTQQMADQTRRLPAPTAAEAAILDEYRQELMALMMSDDEGYDDYEDNEDGEDYEDYDDYDE